jgi:hypothetical protein
MNPGFGLTEQLKRPRSPDFQGIGDRRAFNDGVDCRKGSMRLMIVFVSMFV